MRFIILMFAFALMVGACKKSTNNKIPFEGVWVESSLRLDTLDFDYAKRLDYGGEHTPLYFSTNTYFDSVLNPVFPVFHTTEYSYYFNKDKSSIFMRNWLISSSTNYGEYKFKQIGDKKFEIDKFYLRRSLPATIEFVRIR